MKHPLNEREHYSNKLTFEMGGAYDKNAKELMEQANKADKRSKRHREPKAQSTSRPS